VTDGVGRGGEETEREREEERESFGILFTVRVREKGRQTYRQAGR